MNTESEKIQREHWDKSAVPFDKANGSDGLPMRQVYVDPLLLEMLGDITDKVVLDGGCGNGYFTEMMAKLHPARVMGVDFSPEMIQIANKKHKRDNTEYRVASLSEKLPWIPDASVDVAVFSLVLNYLPNLEILVGELQRIIKPGGRVLLVVESPMVNAHYFSQQSLRGTPDEAYGKAVGYFEVTPTRRGTPIYAQNEVERYNRPHESYMQPFYNHGFAGTGIREPEITEEVLKAQPNYAPIIHIPRFLFLEFTKMPSQQV